MSRRKRGPKGTAYNEALFRSDIAKQGGPIRVSTGSIDRNSTRTSLTAFVTAMGWQVIDAGAFWLLLDARITLRLVI